MISNSESRGNNVSKKFDDFNADDRIAVKLLENSIFYLFGEIDDDNVADCIKWILYENTDTRDKTLTLYINSTGGDLYNAFALIDTIRNSQYPVRTIAVGSAMSAAFLIFAAGHKGERYAAKNCSFMCHQYSDSLSGKHHDLRATMRDGELCNQKMIDLLKEATGMPPSKIKSKLLPASDVYLSAEECIELGVADHLT
jgi:ATP-dependent Clp protease protease subunit